MADTRDILTLAEARAAIDIGASDTSHDTVLAAVITAMSYRFDDEFGPVVVRTITSEAHDGGSDRVVLRYRPVSSVTTATEYDGTTAQVLTAETNSTKPDNAYLLERGGKSGILRRRSANADARFPSGRQNVVVTYVAGRFASTSVVDQRFKDAARVALVNRWQHYLTSVEGADEYDVPRSSFPTFAIPRFVVEMLDAERQFRGPIG